VPFGPETIPNGPAEATSVGNSVTDPGVIRPMRLVPRSVNHRFPSRPAAIRVGWLAAVMPLEKCRAVTASAAGVNTDVTASAIAATGSVLARAAAVDVLARRSLLVRPCSRYVTARPKRSGASALEFSSSRRSVERHFRS
jgi:hypothetical protein